MTPEHLFALQEGRRKALRDRPRAVSDSDKAETQSESSDSPLSAIRRKCLNCHGGSFKAVKYCPSDGIHSPNRCDLWPLRFGIRRPGVVRKYGKQFLTPKDMPEANVDLEKLP
jgi:hypothetical protein